MIEDYHFGSITILGKTYDYDVEVRFNEEVLAWQRKESHLIDVENVERAVDQMPRTIIIGTGEAGVARVTGEAKNFIKEKGIELIIKKTGKATEIFNDLKNKNEKVIGLFHLTC